MQATVEQCHSTKGRVVNFHTCIHRFTYYTFFDKPHRFMNDLLSKIIAETSKWLIAEPRYPFWYVSH